MCNCGDDFSPGKAGWKANHAYYILVLCRCVPRQRHTPQQPPAGGALQVLIPLLRRVGLATNLIVSS